MRWLLTYDWHEGPGHQQLGYCPSSLGIFNIWMVKISIAIGAHCSLVTMNWVNIGSDNGLLPGSTKPFPEPMLTYQSCGPVTFIWAKIHKRYLSHQFLKRFWCERQKLLRPRPPQKQTENIVTPDRGDLISLKITHPKFHTHLAGVTELSTVI